MALLIGPMVALLGIGAAFVVIRGRARTRQSLYASLREDRAARIRSARQRTLAPEPALAPVAPLAAPPVQAVAAETPAAAVPAVEAPVAPPTPAAPAATPAPPAATPAPPAAMPAWDVSPTSPA